MTSFVQHFVATQFGNADGADCVIRFYHRHNGCHSYVGEPLYAHTLILRGGSEFFRVLIENWGRWGAHSDGLYKTGQKRTLCRTADSYECERPRLRVRLSISADVGSTALMRPERPALREIFVPLDSAEELQPAIEAIRFMYTGLLREDQGRMRELVLIRRQAKFLLVHGCDKACDDALEQFFPMSLSLSGSSSGSSSDCSSSGIDGPLAPVLELYSCRHLLPSEDEDSSVARVFLACRKYLRWRWRSQMPAAACSCTTPVTKADVYAWLLGSGGALRIANDADLLNEWLETPAGLAAELLQSDSLSTDDEATVVLLVEKWELHRRAVPATDEERARLRLQLRLVNCNTAYLFDVLPKLPWVGAQKAALLARFRMTDRLYWQKHGSQLGGNDTGSPWYGKPRPQAVPAEGVSYRWEISRENLLSGLKGEGTALKYIPTEFQRTHAYGGGAYSLMALGFSWGLRVQYKPGDAHAGLYISCCPLWHTEVLTGKLKGGASVSACVEMLDGAGGVCKRMVDNELVLYGTTRGWEDAMPLAAAAAAMAQPAGAEQLPGQEEGGTEDADAALLAPWAKLLGPGGKLAGVFTFLRPGA